MATKEKTLFIIFTDDDSKKKIIDIFFDFIKKYGKNIELCTSEVPDRWAHPMKRMLHEDDFFCTTAQIIDSEKKQVNELIQFSAHFDTEIGVSGSIFVMKGDKIKIVDERTIKIIRPVDGTREKEEEIQLCGFFR